MKFSKILVSTIIALSSFSCAGNISDKAKNSIDNYSEKKSNSETTFEVEEFTLDNGLKVYLNKNPEIPRFRAEIVVNSGSKSDPAEATGIAHYLEHMLFKGTEEMGTLDYTKEKPLLDKINELYDIRFNEKDETKRKNLEKEINKLTIEASKYAVPNELSAFYSKIGGRGLNAYTANDETVYLVDLPKNRLEQWAMLESNRFEKPVFRLFQPELEIVYEEKNRSIDNKERILWETIFSKLYKKHQYGTQTGIGTIEHLKNPSLTKMYDFYKKYYVPNNMAIVISGDINIKETKEIITKYFSKWKKKELPSYTPIKEAEIPVVEKTSVDFKGKEKVMIGFRGANRSDKDRIALDFLVEVLSNPEAGLIPLNLVETQKVKEAYAFNYTRTDYGETFLAGSPKEGQTLEEVEKLLLEQLDKLKKGDFDESLLKGIVLDSLKSKKYQLESNEGRVSIMKEAFLSNMDVKEFFDYDKEFKKMTKDYIVKIANKYFSKNYVTVYRRDKEATLQKVEKPNLEKVNLNNNMKSNFIKDLEKVKTKPVDPKWVDYDNDFKVSSYAPGTVMYHTNNNLNDLFNLTFSYDYGSKHNKNLCSVLDELNFAGVDKLSAEDVKKEFFKMGVSFSVGCGDYSSYINISGVDENFEPALKLAEKIVAEPKLSQEHFQDSVANLLTSRKQQKKDVNAISSALISYITRGDESNYKDRLKKEDLEKISVNEYPNLKNKWMKHNFTIYYSGKRNPEEVESIIKSNHYPKKINVPLLKSREALPYKTLKRHNKTAKIYFTNYPGAQAHINLLISGDETNPEETLITNFYNKYMSGGMGAILFQEIREARALAYSTYGNYYLANKLGDEDEYEGYIGTQADKTVEALKTFMEIIKNPPESEIHFQRAKDDLENSYRTGYKTFKNVVGSVESWANLGYDKDPRPEFFEKLNQLSMKDFIKFIDDKIKSKPMTFTIVGDKTKIDLNNLKKIAEVEEINIDDLFTE